MNSLYVKILVFMVFILLVYFILNSSNKKEKFVNDMSGNRFDDLLMIRRRIERVMGPKELVKLSVNNISEMMSKFNDFFYVLVDSGNVGSKMNAYYFANHLGMDTVNKYYIGNMEGLTIPPFLKNFVIKPINLSSSRGLLIIKDRVDILDNNVFDNNNDILFYYSNKYSDFPEDTQFIVEEFINNDIRPLQVNFYSFNGKSPLLKVTEWHDFNKQWNYIYDDKWNLLYKVEPKMNPNNGVPKPKGLEKALQSANKLSKTIGTFIRIDFLLDNDSGVLKMNETSILPFCGTHKMVWETDDTETGEKVQHEKLIFTEEVQQMLGKEFQNCFPFNHEDYKNMYKKSLEYNIPEPCRSHYK